MSTESSPAVDDDDTHLKCSICYDLFTKPVSINPCGHCFCESCIITWLTRSNTCPMCRTSLHCGLINPWILNCEVQSMVSQIKSIQPPVISSAVVNTLPTSAPRRRNWHDTNRPKRSCTAFIHFSHYYRPIILNEFPGIIFSDVGRVCGERWIAIRDTPESVIYHQQAEQDRLRYAEEMRVYELSH